MEKGVREKSQSVTVEDLERIVFGALDGEHSLNNLPDSVFIEDRIKPHTFFKKYASKGVPDIRVIVCSGVPVMAMMRLPTIYSDGKANLHLGALGVGIDMRTGITTYGVVGTQPVMYIPGTKIKVRGIRIPDWDKILQLQLNRSRHHGWAFVELILLLIMSLVL